MAEKIEMPQLSDTMESGKIVKWFVEEGDTVERGDVLAEVETDKATMDLEAFDDGVLLKKLVGEGGEAPTQSTIAVIGEEGEDVTGLLSEDDGTEEPAQDDDDQGDAKKEPEETADDSEKTEEEPDDEDSTDASDDVSQSPPEPERESESESRISTEPISESDRLRASPVARRMAAEEGVDLQSLEGSGPEGRILKQDVEEARRKGGAGMTPVDGYSGRGTSPLKDEKRNLSGMRKTIAERMSEAKSKVPHFYLEQEIDMEQATSLVDSLKDEGREVSMNDLLMMTVARSLCEVPRMNSSYQEDHVQLHGQVDLGFAVAVEDGLYTPVVRSAETKSIEQIHQESQDFIARARDGDLKPDEYKGATFTISNLGMFDIKNFSAVINPPEAGILAVGTVEDRPVADCDTVEIEKRMSVTLSCDHRAVDGAIGARYLQAFKTMLENPARMFM